MKTTKKIVAATELPAVEVRLSEIHGLGVFARRAMRRGRVIGPYAGKRYAPGKQPAKWNDQLTYLFGLSDGSVIDGADGGNATRHINHACAPNVEAVESYDANGELMVAVHVLRPIRAGEEVFLDYALEIDGDDPADYPCSCGVEHCRGTMASLPVEEAS